MVNDDARWRGITLGEQSLIQYLLPDAMNERVSVTQFIRGKLMDESHGSPELVTAKLFREGGILPVVAPLQKHGTAFIEAVPVWSLPCRPEADAVFLRRPGVFASLRFADCIPVVVVSEQPYDWCLLVHSGFRGTCSRICSRAIRGISGKTGSDASLSAHVWVGPGIASCCYTRRLDDPLTISGINYLPSECIIREVNTVSLDLGKAIITTLYDMGFTPDRVHLVDICTSCSTGLCYSYRRGDIQNRSILLARVFPFRHNQMYWWENESDASSRKQIRPLRGEY
jgi:copper oxidase (laccase) domain-containing protein